MGSDSVSLEQILDLEKIEVWTYRGFSWHPESTRVFGGQVAGQAGRRPGWSRSTCGKARKGRPPSARSRRRCGPARRWGLPRTATFERFADADYVSYRKD